MVSFTDILLSAGLFVVPGVICLGLYVMEAAFLLFNLAWWREIVIEQKH